MCGGSHDSRTRKGINRTKSEGFRDVPNVFECSVSSTDRKAPLKRCGITVFQSPKDLSLSRQHKSLRLSMENRTAAEMCNLESMFASNCWRTQQFDTNMDSRLSRSPLGRRARGRKKKETSGVLQHGNHV
jgi:hypothetical protein